MATTLEPLIARARDGDRAALEALAACADRFVRLFHGSVSRQLRRTTGSTVDFVLEGLAQALARLDGFEYRSDEQFYAWIAQHIRHCVIDAARHEGRDKRAGRPAELGSRDEELVSPDPGASTLVAGADASDAIARAIVTIQVEHPEAMEVVVLKIVDGASWPEIRQRLALSSEKRARTLFARGIDLLRPEVERRLGPASFELLLGE